MSITRTRASSSTTRKTAPCALRPPSTTPTISASASACATCRNCARSALRPIEVERLSHDCMLAEDTFQAINSPLALDRQRASGLRFADSRVQSLWHGIILFRLLPDGLRSADLRQHLASLTGRSPDALSQAKAPSPTSFAVCVSTASSNTYPTASAI